MTESFALDLSRAGRITVVAGSGGEVTFPAEHGWWVANTLVGADASYAGLRVLHAGARVSLSNEAGSISLTREVAGRLAGELERMPFGGAVTLVPGTADARVAAIEAGIGSEDPEEVYDALVDIRKQRRRDLVHLAEACLASSHDFVREEAQVTLDALRS